MDNLDKWLEKPYTDELPTNTYLFEIAMHKEVEIEADSEEEAEEIISDNLSDYIDEDDIEIR